MTALARLIDSRLLAIVRSKSADNATRIVETLLDSGIGAVEVSLTTPNAVEIIRAFQGSNSLVGAGTVMTVKQTEAVSEAGARFIVTPAIAESVDEARRLGIESFVGVMTPSEAVEAMRRGATGIKLFPAEIGGPRFLRAVRDPLPDYNFIPVGGVTTDLVDEYLNAGALALGVGSPLTGASTAVPDLGLVRARTAEYHERIASWKDARAHV